jgi:hypothetical protein
MLTVIPVIPTSVFVPRQIQLCLQELFAIQAQWSEQVFQKYMEKVSVCQGSSSRLGGLPEHASCHSNKAGMSVEVGGVRQIS